MWTEQIIQAMGVMNCQVNTGGGGSPGIRPGICGIPPPGIRQRQHCRLQRHTLCAQHPHKHGPDRKQPSTSRITRRYGDMGAGQRRRSAHHGASG